MLTISTVIEQYMKAKQAQRISMNTLKDYGNAYRKFKLSVGNDKPIQDITIADVVGFLGSCKNLSKKTVLNHHTALSSLWNWAHTQQIVTENIIRRIPPPRPEKREILPLSKKEVESLFEATQYSTFPDRDRLILLMFLDTGMRLSELANIQLVDLNLSDESYVVVFGKGSKERRLPLSQVTKDSIKKYIDTRRKVAPGKQNILLVNERGETLTSSGIRKVLYRLSKIANIPRVYPHKLRHTFAIWYLRLGGNIYVLQKILGHSTLDMVKRYLAIAQSDIDKDHHHASPISRWNIY